MDLGLSGRRALVTGSHRGTGRGIAQVLAREGASVVVHGFELEPAERVAAEIRDAGLAARAVAGDLMDDSAAAALAAEVGDVDVLVNNYGVAEGGSWTSETSDWIDAYEKNVLSGVRLVHAFAPGMRERGFGRIVFVSTVGAIRPRDKMPHYYASKAALVNVGLSLAKELRATGVTVNVVSPGLIATDEVREGLIARARRDGKDDDWETVQQEATRGFMPNLIGRIPTPEEIGAFVAYLASDAAGIITGTNHRIDGGTADVAV